MLCYQTGVPRSESILQQNQIAGSCGVAKRLKASLALSQKKDKKKGILTRKQCERKTIGHCSPPGQVQDQSEGCGGRAKPLPALRCDTLGSEVSTVGDLWGEVLGDVDPLLPAFSGRRGRRAFPVICPRSREPLHRAPEHLCECGKQAVTTATPNGTNRGASP